MFLGYIISKENIEDRDSCFGYTEEDVHTSIPKLIVGWEYAKNLYPQISIIDNQIYEDVYWTFSPEENLYEYEQGMRLFETACVDYWSKASKYDFLNIFAVNRNVLKKIVKYLSFSDVISIYSIEERFAYLYNGDKVVGISLSDCAYIGSNGLERILQILNKKHKKIQRVSFDYVNHHRTIRHLLDNKKYIIPIIGYDNSKD